MARTCVFSVWVYEQQEWQSPIPYWLDFWENLLSGFCYSAGSDSGFSAGWHLAMLWLWMQSCDTSRIHSLPYDRPFFHKICRNKVVLRFQTPVPAKCSYLTQGLKATSCERHREGKQSDISGVGAHSEHRPSSGNQAKKEPLDSEGRNGTKLVFRFPTEIY